MELENVVSLPNNIITFLKQHISNIQININTTDALNGYGIKLNVCVIVSMYFKKCIRKGCKYHSLYNPTYENEDINHRHSYSEGYEDVFFWRPESAKTLEEAFDMFLKAQPEKWYEPVICASFLNQKQIQINEKP